VVLLVVADVGGRLGSQSPNARVPGAVGWTGTTLTFRETYSARDVPPNPRMNARHLCAIDDRGRFPPDLDGGAGAVLSR